MWGEARHCCRTQTCSRPLYRGAPPSWLCKGMPASLWGTEKQSKEWTKCVKRPCVKRNAQRIIEARVGLWVLGDPQALAGGGGKKVCGGPPQLHHNCLGVLGHVEMCIRYDTITGECSGGEVPTTEQKTGVRSRSGFPGRHTAVRGGSALGLGAGRVGGSRAGGGRGRSSLARQGVRKWRV